MTIKGISRICSENSILSILEEFKKMIISVEQLVLGYHGCLVSRGQVPDNAGWSWGKNKLNYAVIMNLNLYGEKVD